jgi:hypothetical protein
MASNGSLTFRMGVTGSGRPSGTSDPDIGDLRDLILSRFSAKRARTTERHFPQLFVLPLTTRIGGSKTSPPQEQDHAIGTEDMGAESFGSFMLSLPKVVDLQYSAGIVEHLPQEVEAPDVTEWTDMSAVRPHSHDHETFLFDPVLTGTGKLMESLPYFAVSQKEAGRRLHCPQVFTFPLRK